MKKKHKKQRGVLPQTDFETKRISRRQYNKELDESVSRMEKGNVVSHSDALKALSEW